MSTVAKLDPMVRRARTARRATIRALGQVAYHLRRDPNGGLRSVTAALVADTLQMIRKDPTTSGAAKQTLFNNIITRLQEKL
jgi:hypothetical protein